MSESIEHDAQAAADTPEDEADKDAAAASWGPTFGPETGYDAARPKPEWRGWHPPGGSI